MAHRSRSNLLPKPGLVLGLLLALAGSGCSSTSGPPRVTLSGHVVGPAGEPVEGIDVGYYKKGVFASDSAAKTESDGSWEFEVPEPFMKAPAGRVFFQDKGKKWAMAMHRADELPEPVTLEPAPEPRPEPETESPAESPAEAASDK